jgi:uncharacterized membrane protein
MPINPQSTAKIGGHPIHPMLVPFPIACFVGTFVTDLVYWKTFDPMWANFSSWLLLAGLVMAALAAVAGLIDFLGSAQIRALKPARIHLIGNVAAVLLSLVNAFVHGRDGYTAIVPTGLMLSTLVVVILLVTGWMGWEMVYRGRVGVADNA